MVTMFEKFHSHYQDQYILRRLSNTQFAIDPKENYEGQSNILINAHSRIWTLPNRQLIDISKIGLGGRVDGIAETNSSYYCLWALFNNTGMQLNGFGLTKLPSETATNVVGNVITLPRSYMFTAGATVLIYTSNVDFDGGIVSSVDATTITVSLFGTGPGLTGTTPVVTQFNKYMPYNNQYSADAGQQTLFCSKFKLIDSYSIYNNSSGNLQQVFDPDGGYLIKINSHRNMTTPAQIIHRDYEILDGTKVINPLSPIFNTAKIDYITDSRFDRASLTSGTLQADQFQGHYHNRTGSANLVATGGGTPAYNIPAGTSQHYTGLTVTNPITDGVNGAPRYGLETRPINVSAVPIMKVNPFKYV